MVSEVEGELRDGVGDAGLLRATFPPGSVTGAPKLAALDVIAELESTGREAYTRGDRLRQPARRAGAQRRDPHVRGRAASGSGSAPAAASSPTRWRRTRRARRRPRRAAARRDRRAAAGAAGSRRGRPRRSGAAPRPVRGPIPRPGCTRRSWSPTARRRTSTPHLARLAASLAALYGLAPAGTSPRARAAAARGHEPGAAADRRAPRRGGDARRHAARRGRARRAAPRRGARRPRPAQVARPRACSSRTRPTTRRPSRSCSTPTASCSRRAARASSCATPPARCHTPPADGRILPGVTAALARARAAGLTLADLDAAAEVYVASALRGLSPAARTPAA